MLEMQGNALKSICSVYVPVQKPLRSAQWWQSNFGLEYAVPYNEEEADVILKLSDGQWLHLVKSDQPGQAGSPMFRLTFEVRQIEVLHDHLKKNGVIIEDLVDRGSCGINFVFYDLDGNKFDVNECVSIHRSPEEVDRVKAHLFNLIN
ncbi:hypothetical protein PAALTS15_28616 [Paenibacillus alvei TS-15]|uniref:VOC domain-containing protein n=1 Tax=Paenibacillus alvei TS-15 TaxID=1117108 RepID=S9SI48_PAEAL|nr:VOC family protein [Paenibacillus alvei]EPY03783.1 hypothetical protein PAALTS15_28616 [Paenibacillus alvei TS-15]